ncbi:GLIPR1-like protein 1 isoform X2 [Dasypus novemcinctus]|uniref:GLIPR1-like protein 1 isoform X2 n=1 Tax=Dasypus novemcinctus TaxID=9361 RepID=UPI00265F3317|nr:GLIPR1-like protein 1 isoform X2 [Dasypus novemcinctus]
MALRKKLSCLWILGLCLVTSRCSPQVPSISDQSFIDECVQTHNDLRSKVSPTASDMRYMTWDEALAKTAKAWTKSCKFKNNPCSSKPNLCHPNFHYVGENIWIGEIGTFKASIPIISWYNESTFYNFNKNSCSRECSHYKQVVWAKSYKVGCAVTICPTLGGANTGLFACDYAPPGNYPKALPYKSGVSCSVCTGENCTQNLCQNL